LCQHLVGRAEFATACGIQQFVVRNGPGQRERKASGYFEGIEFLAPLYSVEKLGMREEVLQSHAERCIERAFFDCKRSERRDLRHFGFCQVAAKGASPKSAGKVTETTRIIGSRRLTPEQARFEVRLPNQPVRDLPGDHVHAFREGGGRSLRLIEVVERERFIDRQATHVNGGVR
jgi:hypothetical protein